MTTNRILLGEWLPDQPDSTGSPAPNLEMAFNVYPSSTGYAPFPRATRITIDMPNNERINGLYSARQNEQITAIVGTNSNIYRGNNIVKAVAGTINDISRPEGYASNRRNWHFEQFGSIVLGTNGTAKIQKYDMAGDATFTDIEQAPVCRTMAIVRDFVFAGYCDATSNKVQWSDLNNENVWDSDDTNQADFQILPSGGAVKAVTGGEFGLVIQEKAVQRASYIGTPFVFQFDLISDNTGCISGASAIQYNGISYWLSESGMVACDGTKVSNIGEGKINDWLFKEIDKTQIEDVSVAIDPLKNLIVWNFPTSSEDRVLLKYNYETGRFSTGKSLAQVVAGLMTQSASLDSLDAEYPILDDMPISLDSGLLIGGQFSFCGAEDKHVVAFSLLPETCYMTTNDMEFDGFSVATVAMPIIENGSAEFQIASRNSLNENILFSNNSVTSAENRADLRSGGKYHRVRIHPTGVKWTNAVGFDLAVTPQGSR
jgi:hypothetical protein